MAKRETKVRAKLGLPAIGDADAWELFKRMLEVAAADAGIRVVNIIQIHNPAQVILMNDSESQGDISKEKAMSGDRFQATGPVGIQGHHGKARDISQVQENKAAVDLGDIQILAAELSSLHAEMKQCGSEIEQEEAALEIRKAAAAAKKNDKSAVMEHLKKAGSWALEVATAIGVPVAIDALKKSLSG